MKTIKELLEQAIAEQINESKFKKGQKVKVMNARKYDSTASSNTIEGVVDFIWSDGRVAVNYDDPRGIGGAQMNVDPKDLK